jgi:hypothetical protein
MKPYKSHWVCMACRFTCKLDPAICDARLEKKPCPNCGEPFGMVDAGRDFKPPRKRDKNGWATVISLLAQGVRYNSCGCNGPGYRPRTKAALRHWDGGR